MLETIASPPSLKPHAPRIETVKVPVDKIGAIIGPGGKNIRALQEDTPPRLISMTTVRFYIASPTAWL
jgi:polyribonucleotide nucleotidyltransferase